MKAEQALLSYFDSHQRDLARAFITEQYACFSSLHTFDLDDIQHRNYQLLLLIHHILRQLHLDPESILGEEFFLYTQVSALTSVDQIVGWFHNIVDVCFDAIHERSMKSTKKLIDKAKEYLCANYHQNIGLEHVADHLHISPEHLSREFKKELGENFVDYLLHLRMMKAKEYLGQGTYKTCEIANLVGFNDEKYFSKVFKKNTGFTPSEYKFRIT